jgi:hypothetical protein
VHGALDEQGQDGGPDVAAPAAPAPSAAPVMVAVFVAVWAERGAEAAEAEPAKAAPTGFVHVAKASHSSLSNLSLIG